MESAGTNQANTLFVQRLLIEYLLFPQVSKGRIQNVLLFTGGWRWWEKINPCLEEQEL